MIFAGWALAATIVVSEVFTSGGSESGVAFWACWLGCLGRGGELDKKT
jgi:hypothetical protein